MSMAIRPVTFSGTESIQAADKAKETESVKTPAMVDKKDSVELSKEAKHLKEGGSLSKEDKQELIKKARSKAAGYSVFGGGFSTLYYALRSDNKIAEKYQLDPEKDKALIKKIKQDQTLFTLPSLVGFGLIPYIIAKVSSPENIDPDKKFI